MSKNKNLLISSTIKAKSWLNNIDDNYSKIKIKELLDDKGHLEAVLKKGKEKASKKAEENLKKVREIVGLL